MLHKRMKDLLISSFCIVFILCTAESADDVCNNGGKRINGNHVKCVCPYGYKGFDCNQRVSPCEGRPCRNYGKCTEHEDGTFSCKCSPKYEGLLCEKKLTPCDSHPCKNGGKCTDDGDKCFKCQCSSGFKGTDCSQKVMPCEVFPCQNGGVCANLKDGGFKCTCTKEYGGKYCEHKDVLYSSHVLEGKVDYVEKLQTWLNGESKWRLCYRASRDGWKAAQFHSRCDFKGPTVTLVRAGYYIFGGYSDIAWGGSAAYKTSSKAFLFSFRNKDNLAPFKSPVYKNQQNAIYTNPSYGPTFGGGHDLYIRDSANANTGSYTNFGHTYKPPSSPHRSYPYGNSHTQSLLAGNYNKWYASEVEVFYLG